MLESFDIWMLIFMGLIAFLYASVGHGGASGFIAIMALWSMPTNTMRVIALTLNVIVSSISFAHYYFKNHFKWRIFLPFTATSIPAAVLGSMITLDPTIFKRLLSIVLLIPIIRLSTVVQKRNLATDSGLIQEVQEQWSDGFRINFRTATFAVGGIIGFLSGMLGIGGGILLSPVLIFMGWGSIKGTAAVTALFTCVNSVAGLLTQLHHWQDFAFFPAETMLLFSFVLLGGWLGSWWGSGPAQEIWIKRVLALVLGIASWKLIFV